jgi:DNA replication protein DnaC
VLPGRAEKFNAACIPARHVDCTLDSFDGSRARPAFAAMKGWLERYRPGRENEGLVLYGEPGRGKTHLLCAAIRHLALVHGVGARFIEFTHLVSAIKEGYDRGLGEARLLGPLVSVPVLAIDELGRGRATDWERSILDELVSRRYNARATILATTNFPARKDEYGEPPAGGGRNLSVAGHETLEERIGDRTWSRLSEICKFVQVTGDDFRVTRRRRPSPSAAP